MDYEKKKLNTEIKANSDSEEDSMSEAQQRNTHQLSFVNNVVTKLIYF